MKGKYTAKTTRKNAWSFGNLCARVFSAFLLIVVFVSPLAPAFASEEGAAAVEASSNEQATVNESSENADAEEPEVEAEHSADEDLSPEEVSEQVVTETETDPEVLVDQGVSEDSSGVLELPQDELLTENALSEGEKSTNSEATKTSLSDLENEAGPESESAPIEDVLTVPTTPDAISDPTEATSTSEISTSTSETVVTEPQDGAILEEVEMGSSTQPEEIPENSSSTDIEVVPQPVISEGFTFSQNECVPTGEGAYYCTRPKESETTEVVTDGVFARLDEKGDKEIYLERGGVVTQVTDNDFDDNAPYFDESSATIVWHRLIDGRYQIMSYSLTSQTETQITFDRYNNMEPQIFGTTIVWQGWVGNDWEIFMLTGDNLLMLTDNTIQDITPSINGDHIVWQSFEGDAWRMKVYDIRTKQVETIEDAGGASIENPRFVLVYDTKFASGDVETRGYDLKSGKVVFLDSRPAPLPEEIPDPEQTGEDRALVVPPPQPKGKVESDDDLDKDSSGAGPLPHDDGQDDDMTLVILGGQSDSSDELNASSTLDGSFDLVVSTDEVSTTTADTSHIDDLVVAPYVPSSLVDSQEAIEAAD